ncbi:SH3 domain-binding protein 4 isoform X3 [Candoia aspera]|uniref:SH3 domain-binding protein 4 isoform X3 n=1 Tax=Candoia aspera TaxID=51853 RepID=UPI002FD82749
MAAQRIRAANASCLSRCKSEGTLIDLSEEFSETSFSSVKVPSPGALMTDSPTSFGTAKEVVAIKDYCPNNFTTLKFSKGDHLYVLDTSGELDSEPECVASVLEKLKEDCNNSESKDKKSFQKELMSALLKMDCQGLVVRLIQDFVLLTTAVEVSQRWRELAEKLAKVSKQQMDAYEAPHRDKNGAVDSEAMWKPAYDFMLTWSNQMGDSYRDVTQELHIGLDKMKNPITKRWKHLTGTLILVNSLDILRAAAFSPQEEYDDYAI